MSVFKSLCNGVQRVFEHEVVREIVTDPLANLVVESSKEIVTTIGSYIVQSFVGTFQKSIEFETRGYYNEMEKAFYNIINRWNKLQTKSKFLIKNDEITNYKLAEGYHNLKYRNWHIVLIIKSERTKDDCRRTKYTIIGYDLSNNFVTQFHRDLKQEINLIRNVSPLSKFIKTRNMSMNQYGINSYDADIYKRPEQTIYLPKDIKNKIKKTFNNFINNKEFYIRNGIPYQLNVLLYGPPGTGKDSIVKMIATMYNLSIAYINEVDYSNIPKIFDEIQDSAYHREFCNKSLIVLSDFDKYPGLIDEANIDFDKNDVNMSTKAKNSSLFAKMINIMDGLGSDGGRIIIITTNHIEKFSKTFIRPGRIHLLLEIPYLTKEVFGDFFHHYFKDTELPEQFELTSDKFTVAEMQNDLLCEFKSQEFIDKYIRIK